jgi:hypothetical protein
VAIDPSSSRIMRDSSESHHRQREQTVQEMDAYVFA